MDGACGGEKLHGQCGVNMIRQATADDLGALVELSRQMHAESPRFRRLRFDADKMRATAAGLVASPHGFAWVVEADGMVIGGLLAMVCEHWCSSDKVAVDYGLYVKPGARGAGNDAVALAKQYAAWAREQGAVWPQAGITAGIGDAAAEKVYRYAGGQQVGTIWEL